MYFFIVDFYEAASDEMRFRVVIFSYCYNLAECSRNNSTSFLAFVTAHHRVSFATSSLPVSEDGPIISIKYTFDQSESALLVNEILWWIRRKDTIEWKSFRLLFGIFFDQKNLIILRIDVNHADTSYFMIYFTSLLLFGAHRPASDHDLDGFWHFPLLKILYCLFIV